MTGTHPCVYCNAPRLKVDGWKIFTICDKCWAKRTAKEKVK
jgi:hypothetical protein